MKERYLQYEKAGDQYLGRVVSGLDVNTKDFAVWPPYFEFNKTDGPDDVLDNGTWKKVYTLLRDYMVCGHSLVQVCIASFTFALHRYVFTLTF